MSYALMLAKCILLFAYLFRFIVLTTIAGMSCLFRFRLKFCFFFLKTILFFS